MKSYLRFMCLKFNIFYDNLVMNFKYIINIINLLFLSMGKPNDEILMFGLFLFDHV